MDDRSNGMGRVWCHCLLVVILGLTSCSQARDVRIVNACPGPIWIALWGGTRPPSQWGPETTVQGSATVTLEDSLPGGPGDTGLIRIRSTPHGAQVERIGSEDVDVVSFTVSGLLCA